MRPPFRRLRALGHSIPCSTAFARELPRSLAPDLPRIAADARDVPALSDDAWVIAPASLTEGTAPDALATALPTPTSLEIGWLVVLGAAPARGWLSRLRGRAPELPRGVRGAALLLAGYRAIGGGIDRASGLDWVWGRVPPRAGV
jgi:hypothetical protein